jgi:hypothetical protein
VKPKKLVEGQKVSRSAITTNHVSYGEGKLGGQFLRPICSPQRRRDVSAFVKFNALVCASF